VLVPAGSEGSGIAGRAPPECRHNQWAPRLEWPIASITKRSSAPARVFSIRTSSPKREQSLEVNPPNNVRVSFTTNKALPPTLLLSNGFAPNALSLQCVPTWNGFPTTKRGVTPADYQWNFNIQRQLPAAFSWNGLLRQQAGPHCGRSMAIPRHPKPATSIRPPYQTRLVRARTIRSHSLTGSHPEGWLERL